MKKIMIGIGVFIGVVVVGIVLYIGILAIITRCAPYTVTKAEISIHADGVQRANMHQDEAYVKMMAVNDKLYFYIESWWEKHGLRRKFNRKLCEIGNGEIQSVADFGVVYGYDQRYIYAHIDNELVAFDMQTNTQRSLTTCSQSLYDPLVFIDSDWTLRVKLVTQEEFYYEIKDGKLLNTHLADDLYEEYELSGKTYAVSGDTGGVFCQGEDITKYLGSAYYRALVPYQDGLLLMNNGSQNLVYYIESDGTISSLFPEIPCKSTLSCINFYENYIFVSFLRRGELTNYETFEYYENDTLSGTYRIDMTDRSVKKISDNIYNGMYIFDDSGIYACNRDGDIHHLDFDGNVVNKVVD